MLTAVATQTGSSVEVQFVGAADTEESSSAVEPKDGPSPIAPEMKELAWTAGAFIVFAVLMRVVLYPRLKQGTDARYASIRAGHEGAAAVRAAARAEVAEYETQLATVKAEANERIEVARRTLDAESAARLSEVNARIEERRQSAMAAASAEREAMRGDLEASAADVVSRMVELAVGQRPDERIVSEAVSASLMEGAHR